VKKNNLFNPLKKHKKKIIIIFLSFFFFIGTASVVKNAERIYNALSFKNRTSHSVSKHTPQRLQWIDSFKGIDNMKKSN